MASFFFGLFGSAGFLALPGVQGRGSDALYRWFRQPDDVTLIHLPAASLTRIRQLQAQFRLSSRPASAW